MNKECTGSIDRATPEHYVQPCLNNHYKKHILTIQQTYQNFQSKQKVNFIITVCIVVFIFANVLLDLSYTLFQNSSFYISESLLFSSYWLLFLPLLTFVLKTIKETEKIEIKLRAVSFAIAFHLFSYPALVWVISKTFYNHTFDYWQTFNFGQNTRQLF